MLCSITEGKYCMAVTTSASATCKNNQDCKFDFVFSNQGFVNLNRCMGGCEITF